MDKVLTFNSTNLSSSINKVLKLFRIIFKMFLYVPFCILDLTTKILEILFWVETKNVRDTKEVWSF